MLDHALETAFLALFQSDGAFAGLHFFTGHDDEQHKLPALNASAKSDPLAGSASVFRGELTLAVESEANDTTPAQHAARVELLRAKLADKAAVIAAINAAGVGTLRVSGVGSPGVQLGTAHPGYSGGFEFKNVPVSPGGTITYSADYGAPGNAPLTHYVGTGSYKFPPYCIVFGATWYGTMTEDKSCQHEGPSGDTEDGYTYNASYSVNGQYAVNPENGSGKSAHQTPVDVNEGEPHIHWTNDTRPDGTHTEGDIPLYPPGSVTVDVNNGGVSNLQPDKLGVFGEPQHNETQDPTCTFDKTTDEGSSP